MDVGGTAGAPSIDSAAFEKARREALAARAAGRPAGPSLIEGTDPALREALTALGQKASVQAHLRVAAEYNRVGVRDQAYGHFSDALRLDRHSAAALDGRARLLRDAGLIAMALNDAHRARYFEPRSAGVRNTLGTILERQGLFVESLAEYREAARLRPDAGWARQNVERLTTTCP